MAMTLQQAEQLLGKAAADQIRRKLAPKATAPAAVPKFDRTQHAGGTAEGKVARGRVRTRREEGMNRLEEAYEREVLIPALQKGEIVWYRYESVKVRLADATFLTVDFFVMTAAGELEAHETKGFMEEDANVKLKVARAMFPFRFKLIRKRAKKDGGGFSVEVFE